MSKTKSLTELADLVNNSEEFSYKVNAWEKGGKQRLYLPRKFGYNTKKMSTSAYISLTADKAIAVVTIDCDSQPTPWIVSQEKEHAERLQSYVDFCNENYEFGFTSEPIEVIMNNATLDVQPIQGYFTEWRHMQVKINSYGKLAMRNRQVVVPFTGTKNTAPASFMPLSDKAFAFLRARGEMILDAYEAVPDFDAVIEGQERWQAAEIARIEQNRLDANEKKAADEAAQLATAEKMNQAIANGGDIFTAWKAAGCSHPAPAEVVEAKKASGLNWNNFVAGI